MAGTKPGAPPSAAPAPEETYDAALEAALRRLLRDIADRRYQSAGGAQLTASLAVRDVRALVLLHDVIGAWPVMDGEAVRAALRELIAEAGAHDYRTTDDVRWMATPDFLSAAALLAVGGQRLWC